MNRSLQGFFTFILFIGLFSLSSSMMHADELAYHDRASEIIHSSLQTERDNSFLKKLYKELLFTPVWMRSNALSPAAKELFDYIQNDETLNKNGKLYKESILLKKMAEIVYAQNKNIYAKVSVEFKISQLYKDYTDYAYFGSINWGAFNARISNLMVNDVSTEWVLHRPEIDPVKVLDHVALGSSLKKQFDHYMPTAYHYRELQDELKRYMKIREEGGWEPIYLSKKLKPGQRDRGVYSLRERLRATGDYQGCPESDEEERYDKCLQDAVRHFQKRNGLKADAVVGPVTLAVLNKSVNERITMIRLNLDRIKWLNKREGKRHIIINIPDFRLYFEEEGRLIQSMRVITGSPKHPTPIFSDTVEMIVLNPYWNIPKSIIQKEMIPKLLRNPNAMARQGIEIRAGWGKNAAKISGGSVNWSQYRYSKTVPYRFAQTPGYKNALGKVKFLFPNKFSVYMHDTPTKHLFKRDKRAFSHGCIRLQKPRALLETFSTFNDNIDFEQSQKILKGKKNTYYKLQEKVPVDVVYLTAWVDYEGKLQFRNDVYKYDEMQLKSFRKW
ncbi:MAG TPA: murein L,D-transpeptidase [Sulfurovum sp.]|nr:murein L,D-transpeptidase [Sulfurovum sp.]